MTFMISEYGQNTHILIEAAYVVFSHIAIAAVNQPWYYWEISVPIPKTQETPAPFILDKAIPW
jgi:hypothetical protein